MDGTRHDNTFLMYYPNVSHTIFYTFWHTENSHGNHFSIVNMKVRENTTGRTYKGEYMCRPSAFPSLKINGPPFIPGIIFSLGFSLPFEVYSNGNTIPP